MAFAIADHLPDRDARHGAVIEQLFHAHAKLRDEVIPTVMHALESVRSSPFMIPFRGFVTARIEKVRADLSTADGIIASLLAPVQLPLWLWRNGEEWEHVRGEMSGMVGDLSVTNREIHLRWRGVAAGAYDGVLPAQVGAASQLAKSADSLSYVLDWAGTTAAVFYAGVLAILLQATAGMVMAAVTMIAMQEVATLVILAMAAAALVTELGALIALTADVYGRMKVWTMEVLGELYDASNFPNGEWPLSQSRWYADATVTDGDADWSVAR